MGQPIAVVEKPTSRTGVVRFEINRSLTGMAHERYYSIADTAGDRWPDVLARRLFDKGGVRSVHIYSNIITVELDPGATTAGFSDLIRDLYIHYRPGVTPSVT